MKVAQFNLTRLACCAELGVDELRGRVISLRWLEDRQQSDVWSPAYYTWLSVILLTGIVIVVTLAFKYRYVVCLSVCLSASFHVRLSQKH